MFEKLKTWIANAIIAKKAAIFVHVDSMVRVILPLKHQYSNGWPTGICLYCKRKTGLDSWQLHKMPKSMALCDKGEIANPIKILTGNYNCAP